MNGTASKTPSGADENLPLWRKHFPIDSEDDTTHTRREFIGGLAIAGGAMVCGQVVLDELSPSANENEKFESHPPLTLDINLSELHDGEALLFHYPNHKSPCLLVKIKDDVVAFSQKCTHLACPVIPNAEANQFDCPCHKGTFDLATGAPVSGPPRKPLRQIRIDVSETGTITATAIQIT